MGRPGKYRTVGNPTTSSYCQTTSGHIPGGEPEQWIDGCRKGKTVRKGWFYDESVEHHKQCKQPVSDRAGLTTRLTRLQPRAPTAARGRQFAGAPRELWESYSAGRTINPAILKLVSFYCNNCRQNVKITAKIAEAINQKSNQIRFISGNMAHKTSRETVNIKRRQTYRQTDIRTYNI